MSWRKRSPNANAATPSSLARATAPDMTLSYSSFEQGWGIGASTRGRPRASAWAWSSERRTPCIATRSWTSLTVVRSPTTSTSGVARRTCSAHALSFPLLQASQAFTIDRSPPTGTVAEPAAHGSAERGIAEDVLVLLVEHVLADHVDLEAVEESGAAAKVQALVPGIARQAEPHEVAVRALAHEDERRPEAEALAAREGRERGLVRGPPQQRLALGIDRVEVATALQDLAVEVRVAAEELEPGPRPALHLDLDPPGTR